MLNPRYKNATEFAKKAVISQNWDVYVLVLSLMMPFAFIVTFPKYNPAAAAATKPDSPNEFATTTDPSKTASERAVSENGSSINLWSILAPAENPSPTAMPPKNTMAKWIICSIIFTLMCVWTPDDSSNAPWDTAIATIDENTITPVASLKLASASISVERVAGTLTRLKTSITIAASVGAINAAKANATMVGKPATYDNKSPPIIVARTTPTVASKRAEILIALKCSRSIRIIDS